MTVLSKELRKRRGKGQKVGDAISKRLDLYDASVYKGMDLPAGELTDTQVQIVTPESDLHQRMLNVMVGGSIALVCFNYWSGLYSADLSF